MSHETADSTDTPCSHQVMEHNGYITLWSLRTILKLNIFDRFIDRYGLFENSESLQAIGLHDFYYVDYQGDKPLDRKELKRKLVDRLKQLSAQSGSSSQDAIFLRSIGALSKSLALSNADITLLHFATISPSNQGFILLLELIGDLNYIQTKHTLSTILNLPIAEIEASLEPDSALLSSGLLSVTAGEGYTIRLHSRFELPEGIRQALSNNHKDENSLLKCFFQPAPKKRLSSKDFEHVQQDYALIKTYLAAALKKNTEGVNILIYGDPGTGKTEFARTLCAAGRFGLLEITMKNSQESPISGADRLATLQLSQKLVARKKRCVLLFDEVEDVFPNAEFNVFGQAIASNNKKAWMNHILENNSKPVIWISNSVNQIDPSYLRRFDYVLKLRPLSSRIKLRIIKKYFRHLSVRNEWLVRLSEMEYLVPGLVERAAKVAGHLEQDNPEILERQLDNIIGNTLEVMGRPKGVRKKARYNTQYRLEYLNPDANLQNLCVGLARRQEARICLFGPAGTGKTAFAHYLAEHLGKPILTKRASDILSKWVGEAEQNIANLFHQAAQEDAVILLDEADSFLQDRAGARQSWEVTQVNELLVQMELFNGIFIASTNLMDTLDAASIRRFDFKIKFDYMTSAQAWSMFSQILKEQRQGSISNFEHYKREIAKLDRLTPGDFATVLRQLLSLGESVTPERLLESLAKECLVKPDFSRSIGFV